MKLKQIVCDGTNLNLIKEKKVIKFGEVFEVSDERGEEILKATFKDKLVAELVKEEPTKETTKEVTLRNPVNLTPSDIVIPAALGVRPAVSLKPGAYVSTGNGTSTSPYIIE